MKAVIRMEEQQFVVEIVEEGYATKLIRFQSADLMISHINRAANINTVTLTSSALEGLNSRITEIKNEVNKWKEFRKIIKRLIDTSE